MGQYVRAKLGNVSPQTLIRKGHQLQAFHPRAIGHHQAVGLDRSLVSVARGSLEKKEKRKKKV
jgi:hypothetical protein